MRDYDRRRYDIGVLGLVALAGLGGALALAACGTEMGAADRKNGSPTPTGTGPTGTGAAPTGLPCDVDKILRAKCQTCHGPVAAGGASVSLVTYDDLHKEFAGKKVFELVSQRIHDASNVMPPKPSLLAADEIASLDAWAGAGAPSSSTTCNLAPAPDSVKPLDCTPDVVLKATKPFTMPTPSATDIYMCFGATVNVDKKRHVTAFAPHTDNKKILHHILLFKSPTPVPSEPFACSGVGSAVWQLVTGWAPGGDNLELPPEAGFPEEAGATNWVLQLHYNNASANYGGEVDQSGYELCTTETLRPNDAGIAAFGTMEIAIPPRSKYAITCSFPATIDWVGKKFFNVVPHMHARGAILSTARVPLGVGQPEMIADEENYDFNAQSNRPVSSTVQAGDVFRTRCGWKNPSGDPITFGEGTGQEMCFNFLSYYPAIPGYSWVTPSMSPACVPETAALDDETK